MDSATLHKQLCERVLSWTGFLLDARREASIEHFVQVRCEALNLADPEAYLDQLERAGPKSDEFTRLMNAVTNGETHFFRDPEQFAAFEALLLHRAKQRLASPLQIWSAGCSTGEEPWSLAILCAELGLQAELVATDINTEALEAARRGRYGPWTLRRVSPERLERFFEPVGGELHQVRQARLPPIQWRRMNLLRDPPPVVPGDFDLVVCRNVLIYYPRPEVPKAALRLAGSLCTGGYLVLGPSETLAEVPRSLAPTQLEGRVAYQQLSAPGAAPQTPPPSASAPAAPARPPLKLAGPVHDPKVRAPALPARPKPAPPTLTETAGSAGPDWAGAIAAEAEAQGPEAALKILADQPDPRPHSLSGLLLRGHLHLRQHAFDQALEAWEAAKALDPLVAEAHLMEGLTFRKMGAHERVEAALRSALFLEPKLWQASFLLGGTVSRLGRDAEARRLYAQVLEDLKAAPASSGLRSPLRCLDWSLPNPQGARHACAQLLGRKA